MSINCLVVSPSFLLSYSGDFSRLGKVGAGGGSQCKFTKVLHLPAPHLGLELPTLKVKSPGGWFWDWRSKCPGRR